ncbi:ogr/Delta-like zinc finger family protein, partial [Escherichia coli]|nr:ogr/Delta-like zinc finger family protein [Escherichia coli]
PKCGHAAHTRSSLRVTDQTKERYCQCQNINCGTTFITHETVVRFIMTPGVIDNAPPHPATSGQGHMNFYASNLNVIDTLPNRFALPF